MPSGDDARSVSKEDDTMLKPHMISIQRNHNAIVTDIAGHLLLTRSRWSFIVGSRFKRDRGTAEPCRLNCRCDVDRSRDRASREWVRLNNGRRDESTANDLYA